MCTYFPNDVHVQSKFTIDSGVLTLINVFCTLTGLLLTMMTMRIEFSNWLWTKLENPHYLKRSVPAHAHFKAEPALAHRTSKNISFIIIVFEWLYIFFFTREYVLTTRSALLMISARRTLAAILFLLVLYNSWHALFVQVGIET